MWSFHPSVSWEAGCVEFYGGSPAADVLDIMKFPFCLFCVDNKAE